MPNSDSRLRNDDYLKFAVIVSQKANSTFLGMEMTVEYGDGKGPRPYPDPIGLYPFLRVRVYFFWTFRVRV